MPVDVRVSNPERPFTAAPAALLELEGLIRAELVGVSAPTMPYLAARREALRILARTKTALAIHRRNAPTIPASDADFAGASDRQSYAGYTLSFDADDQVDSVDLGGDVWEPASSGCAFPIDPDDETASNEAVGGDGGSADGDAAAGEAAADEDAAGDAAEDEGAFFYLSIFDTSAREALVRTCTFTLPRTQSFEPAGVALLFSHTRSKIFDVEAVGLPENDLVTVPAPTDGARFLAWHGTTCCSEVSFRVRFVGDNPFVRDHTWLAPAANDAQVPCVAPPDIDPCDPRRPKPPAIARLADVAAVAGFARTRSQESALRRALVDGADRSHAEAAKIARYQAFWTQLDAATNPPLMIESAGGVTAEIESLIGDIQIVGAFLQSSYIDRAQRVAEGLSALDARPLRGYAAHRLRSIAAFTKAQFERPVGDEAPLDRDELIEAIELFAGGRLTVFEAQGAPNGVNYFCFAELAIQLLLVEPDAFWSDLLPVFARTAELFANAYHMPGGQRRSCAYGIAFNPDGARNYAVAERRQLAEKWRGFAGDALVAHYGKVLAAALADELEWNPPYLRAQFATLLTDHE